MTIDFAGATDPENKVLAKYPEAHARLDDGDYVILSNETEDAIQLGYFEETEEKAWESALAVCKIREAEDLNFGFCSVVFFMFAFFLWLIVYRYCRGQDKAS